MDESARNAILPNTVNEVKLEMLEYLESSMSIIESEGGFGRIEFKFQDDGHGMRLGTKSYSVTHKPDKKIKPRPNYRRVNTRYVASSVNYDKK